MDMGRRGPKRQEGARDKRGKLSRRKADVTTRLSGNLDKSERETLRIGVEARQRLYGFSADVLRDSKCETFVGRLRLSGELTERQWQAAENFHRDYRRMCVARDVPKQMGAVDLNRVHGIGTEEDPDKSVAASAAWANVMAAVQVRQNELRGQGALISSLWECIINDRQFPHMVEWLRQALTALADHYRLPAEREKAA